MAPGFEEVRAAAKTIEGAVARTPFVASRTLSEIAGAALRLKFENLQYTASFKDRGALVKLTSLTPSERKGGVIAVSAGNHAQGVAYHAGRLGIPATVVMPKDTPFSKIAHTEGFGATAVLHGADLRAAETHAAKLQKSQGLTFIHPYDDARIIAGQGTVALEMLEDDPGLEVLVVPVGGGGLIAGCAIAAKAIKPGIEIVGVQAELYPAMRHAVFAKGAADPPEPGGQTIAEGIAVKIPGKLTRAIIEQHVDDIVLVDEAVLERAVQLLIEVEKTVAEGAGAAALAAVLAHGARFADKRVGLVISGGNIDSRLLASVLMRGLVRDGRLVRLRVEISDAPGTLAKVARIIGESEANIIEIYHQRLFYDVPVKLAELDVVIETRDPDHVRRIVESLQAEGLPTRLLSSTAKA